ncbi:multiple PDZ domain protein isoform X4 [Nilaparvata lugens]|uniref:multiple PDZ domain protein isoform X4 n=1 Tax=Nilaparvata lugens TaxID=108931 RepID=UPI00193E0722|nr:multiple PDZ domain protein isoform X4 [Nilaparvata lugens]
MPLNADISTALQLLESIQLTVNQSDDPKLQAQTSADLNLLISALENPIFRSIVTIQDSLSELNVQLHQHPSILPVDFDINVAGELVLNLPPPIYYPTTPTPTTNTELDDQLVPVAKLSQSSSGEPNSPPVISSPGAEDVSLPPITTPTYALEFQKAIEESSQGRDVLTVKLFKPDGSSLGFSVVGLKSEEKGELGIFVQEIQPTGIAGRDGRLHEGDQILAIDGQPLDCAISHQQAIAILQKARGLVELVVARHPTTTASTTPPPASAASASAATPPPPPRDRSPSALSDTSKAGSDMVLNTEWAQVEVIDLINDGSGLGFGIIGGRSTGVVVKTILPGGVADRDARLQSGDHILQIGEVNLRGMGSEQVASVLRQSGSHVRLVVARPVEPTAPDYQALGSHAPIVPTKILADPDELDRHLVQNGYPEVTYNPANGHIIDTYENPFIYSGHDAADRDRHGHDSSLVVDVVRPTLPNTPSLPLLTMDMIPPQTQLPEMDKFTVELRKDSHGLGITIAGYVCEKEELSGIFVKSISEGSAADVCKKIQVNDRIVEVDGQSLQGYTNHEAVEVLRATGQTVCLCLERYLRGPKFEQLQQAIANSELKPPTPNSPSATSLPRFPLNPDGESTTEMDVDVEPEGESRTTMDSLVLHEHEALSRASDLEDVQLLIDDDFEGPLEPAVESAIQAKWSKILGPDVEIVVGQLCKFGEGGGLGISLEGTVDVEDGQEVRPHHYIRSILAEGPVGQNNKLRSGDELLEVNGHRLLGMNHIEVVTILKDLPMHVRMVCARRKGDAPGFGRLIDTSQDRAAFAARNLLGGSLQNLIPAMERLVKAKSDGSLASTATATVTTDPSLSKLKSRSLEPLTGLAMWSSEPHIIELLKGERGLGFSILDYQDPMNASETVIVIRSLVPGGVAQVDGRLIPGDRLLSVNDTALDNASLDQTVQALKGAAKGVVRIGVAKPLPIPDSVSHSQEFVEGLSQATPTLDDHSMYSCSGSLPSDIEDDEDIPPALPTTLPPIEDLNTDDQLSNDELQIEEASTPDTLLQEEEDMALDVVGEETLKTPLPASLEVNIKFNKGSDPLGVTLDCCDGGANGMVVTELSDAGSLSHDGRIVVGDLIIAVNNESLRRVSKAQARAVLRRANLLTAEINVTYIPLKAVLEYSRSTQHAEPAVQNRKPSLHISPRIFPEYYRPNIGQETQQPVAVEAVDAVDAGAAPEDECGGGQEAVRSVLSPVTSGDNESFADCDEELKTGGDVTDTSDEKLPFRDPDFSVSDLSDQEVEVETSPKHAVTICSVDQVHIFESAISDSELYSARTSEQLKSGDSVSIGSSISLSLENSKEEPVIEELVKSDDLKSKAEEDSIEVIDSRQSLSGVLVDDRSEGDTLKEDTNSQLSVNVELPRPLNETHHKSTLSVCLVDEDPLPVPTYSSKSERDVRAPLAKDGCVRRKLLRSASTGQEVDESRMTVTHAATSQSSSILLDKHWGPERAVKVLREPNSSLGISIVGGKVDLYNAGPDSGSAISGIFIKNVLPLSPAGRTGELKTGDRILEVDGIDLRHASHERAVDVIRAAGNPVHFLVQSLVQWSVDGDGESSGMEDGLRKGSSRRRAPAPPSPHGELLKTSPYPIPHPRTPTPELIQEGLTDEQKQGVSSRPSMKVRAPQPPSGAAQKPAASKRYSSDSEDSEDSEDDTRLMEGRIYTKKGVEISRASAGNVKRSKEEIEADPEEEDDFGYTANKVKKKYGALGGAVVVAQLERGHQGLGISLAGHRDRTRMAVFVCGINPKGQAHKAQALKVGDEILEVNGVVLHGRCHLNASAIIKGLPGPVFKVIVLRRQTGLEDLAVKPITQFPVSLDDETPEQKYANFKGLRTVAIRKPGSAVETHTASSPTQQTGQGLGIMIIEGRHTEVGQGIFISDIQEGSAAEQAGLVVGDMILAVNKDSLLGSNYDAAAALLKKTEGMVSLVVCNPNQGKDEDKKTPADGPARTTTPTPAKEAEKPKEPPPDPATAQITPGSESTIEINKDKIGLGLSIVGGSDTLLGVIIIHEVYPDGAAAKDGRLKPGDQLLEVNSEDFRSISHSKALAALRQTPAKVKMVVYRDEVVSSGKEEDILDVVEVELTKKPGKGLGLSIVGRKNGPGIFISDVVQGGAAGTDGRLMKGDQILAVNGQDLKAANQEEAAAVLKTTAGKVTIKLGRLKASEGGWRTVVLEKGVEGLGFSIVGGRSSPHGDMPIYVKTVFERGAAACAGGQLRRGDHIIAVDGLSLDGLTHQEAVAVLKRTHGTVTLTVQP